MRKAVAACGLALGSLLGGSAGAQEPSQQPGHYKAQPLNLRREQRGAQAQGEVGRARLRAGDWSGALQAFDVAIDASMDPTLRRDRGVCHERLGEPYPAIDDYRAYLTAVPDAPDADTVRERLAKLEQETLGYSSASTDVPGDVEGGASAAAAAKKGSVATPGSAAPRDQMEYMEREDDPLQAPLRRAKGWSLAPFFSVHKWLVSPDRALLAPLGLYAGSSFGNGATWAECIGVELRYSFGPSTSLFGEAAYEHFNATAVDPVIISGLSSQIGVEWRVPLDAEYENQLILAAGLGYEHLVVQPGAQAAAGSLGAFVPRLRIGWRHLLTPSAGFDLSLDGGVADFFRYGDFPLDSSNAPTFLVGLNIALVWGM